MRPRTEEGSKGDLEDDRRRDFNREKILEHVQIITELISKPAKDFYIYDISSIQYSIRELKKLPPDILQAVGINVNWIDEQEEKLQPVKVRIYPQMIEEYVSLPVSKLGPGYVGEIEKFLKELKKLPPGTLQTGGIDVNWIDEKEKLLPVLRAHACANSIKSSISKLQEEPNDFDIFDVGRIESGIRELKKLPPDILQAVGIDVNWIDEKEKLLPVLQAHAYVYEIDTNLHVIEQGVNNYTDYFSEIQQNLLPKFKELVMTKYPLNAKSTDVIKQVGRLFDKIEGELEILRVMSSQEDRMNDKKYLNSFISQVNLVRKLFNDLKAKLPDWFSEQSEQSEQSRKSGLWEKLKKLKEIFNMSNIGKR